jgi:hypothetical protein
VDSEGQCQGVSGPVDVGPSDQVADSVVEHVENCQCGLLRRILAKLDRPQR